MTTSFASHFSSSPRPNELVVLAHLQDVSRAHTASLDDLLAPVVKYADLGAHGGLSGPRYAPHTSNAIVQLAHRPRPLTVEWRLEITNISDGRALVASLEFMHDQIAPLRAVEISSPPQMWFEGPPEGRSLYVPLPFGLTDEREFESEGWVIEVLFAAPHPMDVLQRVEEAYGSWVSAANIGAFSDEAFPPKMSRIFPADDPTYRDDSIIFDHEEIYAVEPNASDSIVNVLQWVHVHIAPMASVELYE